MVRSILGFSALLVIAFFLSCCSLWRHSTAPVGAKDYLKKGSDCFAAGDIDGTIANCNKAIEIDPNYAKAYHMRGLACAMKRDLEGAIKDYEKFLELAPNDPQALVIRELVYGLKKRLNK